MTADAPKLVVWMGARVHRQMCMDACRCIELHGRTDVMTVDVFVCKCTRDYIPQRNTGANILYTF